ESAFYKVEITSDLGERLLRLALRLFETSRNDFARHYCIYIATNLYKRDKVRGREILNRILEIEKDSYNLHLLLSIFTGEFSGEFSFEEGLPWIQATLKKIDKGVGDPWGAVLSQINLSDSFYEALAKWVRAQKEKDLGWLLRDFRRRIEAGTSPEAASFEALEAEVGLIKKKKGRRAPT
ncbi:MAG: hypothetical protein ACLGI9_20360, partial [Thermoanaerobaculia bacterium]